MQQVPAERLSSNDRGLHCDFQPHFSAPPSPSRPPPREGSHGCVTVCPLYFMSLSPFISKTFVFFHFVLNCVCMHMYINNCSAWGDEVRAMDPLELEYRWLWVLGTSLGSSARRVHALNHGVISSAPRIHSLDFNYFDSAWKLLNC